MCFLSAVSFQFDVLFIEFITFTHGLYKCHVAACDVAKYLNSVLTLILQEKHVSREALRFFFKKKIIYKEKCRTVTERNQNMRLVKEI